MKNIQIPQEIATKIAESIQTDRSKIEITRQRELSSLNQRLSLTRTLMDRSYEEKLLGKVEEDIWLRKMHQWREEEMHLKSRLAEASTPPSGDCVLSAQRVLELAERAHSVYLTATDPERGELLKTVLSNCVTDGVSLWPTYKKPFDIIFQRAKNEEWRML